MLFYGVRNNFNVIQAVFLDGTLDLIRIMLQTDYYRGDHNKKSLKYYNSELHTEK